jgi:uncharacterized protein YcfJ
MKRHTLVLSVAGMAVFLGGCVNPDGSQNNTGTGALVGAGAGAFLGAIAGGPRNGGAGALIGAAAGALAGGLIGNSADREQEARLRAEAPQTYERAVQGTPLSLADVKALAKAGISEDVMINQIKNSRTVFHLTSTDIIDLRDAGVTDKVVNYMISTPSTVGASSETPGGTTIYIQQPPPPAPVETVTVIAPGPDYVWIDGEWVWNGGWFWVAGHWGYPPHPHAVWIVGRSWHDDHGWHNSHGHWH